MGKYCERGTFIKGRESGISFGHGRVEVLCSGNLSGTLPAPPLSSQGRLQYPSRPALTALGCNQDRGGWARTAPSFAGETEESDCAAESKAGQQGPWLLRAVLTGAGRRETCVGGSRRGVPSLLGCLLEGVGEKYGSHQVLDGTATKATTSARGGRRHSPKQNPCWTVQAARNAEAGKKTTTPRSLPASSQSPPIRRCSGSPEELTAFGQDRPTTPCDPRGGVTRSTHGSQNAPGQSGLFPVCACAVTSAVSEFCVCRFAVRCVVFQRWTGCFLDFVVLLDRFWGGEKGVGYERER